MADENDAPPTKRKGFDLAKLSRPLDIETEHLGTLRVGTLNGAALDKVFPTLPPKKATPDENLARTVMLAVVKIPPLNEGEEAVSLSEEQESQITDLDVQSFARSFLEHVGRKNSIDDAGDIVQPEVALTQYAREKVEKLMETARKWEKDFDRLGLSSATERAVIDSQLINDRLKEMTKLSSIVPNIDPWAGLLTEESLRKEMEEAHRLHEKEVQNSILGLHKSALENCNDHLKEIESMRNLVPNMNLLPGLEAAKRLSEEVENYQRAFKDETDQSALNFNKSFMHTPLSSISAYENNFPPLVIPENPLPKAIESLNAKNDKLIEATLQIAEGVGVGNETNQRLVVEFEKKRLDDAAGQRKSMRVGVWALVFTAFFGLVSCIFAALSYFIPVQNIELSKSDRALVNAQTEGQVQLQQKMLDAQQIQIKLLENTLREFKETRRAPLR